MDYKRSDEENNIYTRFGDVTCEKNQFQAKIGSGKPQMYYTLYG